MILESIGPTLLFILCTAGHSWSQTVVDGGFESAGTIPCDLFTAQLQMGAETNGWSSVTSASAQLHSDDSPTWCGSSTFSVENGSHGHQLPYRGNTYASIVTYGSGCGLASNYRSYLQGSLSTPLTVGEEYVFQFWGSLADSSSYASNNMSVALVDSAFFNSATCSVLSSIIPINVSPFVMDDAVGWLNYGFNFTATSASTHFIIGNFFDDASTSANFKGTLEPVARYYIDEVRLVTVDDSAVVVLGDTRICLGDTAALLAMGATTATWFLSGDTVPIAFGPIQEFSPEVTTSYTIWTDADTLTTTITVVSAYTLPAGFERIGCYDVAEVFDVTTQNAAYIWHDGTVGPTFTTLDTGSFQVDVITQCQIEHADYHLLLEDCTEHVYIPNAFTPNGDGKNDVLRPIFEVDPVKYEFLIFDRWGTPVFSSNDHLVSWPGDPGSTVDGITVYTYWMKYTTIYNEKREKSGHITVLK